MWGFGLGGVKLEDWFVQGCGSSVDRSRSWWRMEKVKWVAEDSNYGGWTSKTSKKGKGPGKSKGRQDNQDDGSGEDLLGRTEDGSWGKDLVVLRWKIRE